MSKVDGHGLYLIGPCTEMRGDQGRSSNRGGGKQSRKQTQCSFGCRCEKGFQEYRQAAYM